MDKEQLQDGLGQVKESLLDEAEAMRSGAYKKQITSRNRRIRRAGWKQMAAVAACICLTFTGVIGSGLWTPFSGTSKMGAVYSEQAMDSAGAEESTEGFVQQLDGAEQVDGSKGTMPVACKAAVISEYKENQGKAKSESLASDQVKSVVDLKSYYRWTGDSIGVFLSGSKDNVLYSPVNLYSMLALMANVGRGDQQAEILKLLKAEDVDALNKQYRQIWNLVNLETEDGNSSVEMANSLWLSDRFAYGEDKLTRLSQDMKISSYIGEMGSEELNTMMQTWANEHTGKMLEGRTEEMSTHPEDLLNLVSTLYYKNKWMEAFSADSTVSGSFYGKAGEQTVAYMVDEREVPYSKGDGYQACFLSTKDGGGMWIVLPNEKTSVDKLLEEKEVISLLEGKVDPDRYEKKAVYLKIPKFDLYTSLDASASLAMLGIVDDLLPDQELFKFSDGKEAYEIHQGINHSVRIRIDEIGCEGAALSATEEDAVDDFESMVIDRPFLISVVSKDRLALFTGVIHKMK